MTPPMIQWTEPLNCCDKAWEQAYAAFETPVQERCKFIRRFRELGAEQWDKDAAVVELFCGRGNGLKGLEQFGFSRLEGVDLSSDLLGQYKGKAQLYVGNCCDLKFEDSSRDYIITQGGLHHLPELPADLEACLREMQRVLRPGGKVLIVEPWLTPFLQVLQTFSRQRLVRWLSPKVDAFERMCDLERETYANWLARPKEILDLLHAYFKPEICHAAWGKLNFVGQAKD